MNNAYTCIGSKLHAVHQYISCLWRWLWKHRFILRAAHYCRYDWKEGPQLKSDFIKTNKRSNFTIITNETCWITDNTFHNLILATPFFLVQILIQCVIRLLLQICNYCRQFKLLWSTIVYRFKQVDGQIFKRITQNNLYF